MTGPRMTAPGAARTPGARTRAVGPGRRTAESRPAGGDCARRRARVSFVGERTVRSGQGVTAVRTPLRQAAARPVPAPLAAARAAFRPADVCSLPPRGPLVRLYGRQHIDLQRVAGALCCR